MRRRGFKALAGIVGAALMTVLGPVGSAHASGFYDCPRGWFCGWDKDSAAGQMIKINTSRPTLGSWDRRIRSWTNRSNQWACLYVQPNYTLGTVDSVEPNATLGSGTGYDLGTSGQIRSIKFVSTERECIQPAYAPFYATARSSPGTFGDMNGDGYADLITRDLAGRLWLSSGADGSGKLIGLGGWNAMTAITRHGDFTGDGHEDLIARDGQGRLWLYPGSATGALQARRLIGAGGWNTMRQIAAVGDFDGDGHADLLALSTSGRLLLYPGTGHGTLGAPRVVRSAFPVATALVGVGDLNHDGRADFVWRNPSGQLWALYGNGHGGIAYGKMIGAGGWNIMTSLVGAGDINGDGRSDLVTLGNLPDHGGYLIGVGRSYPGTAAGGLGNPVILNADWWGLNGIY